MKTSPSVTLRSVRERFDTKGDPRPAGHGFQGFGQIFCLNHRFHSRDLLVTKPPQKSIRGDSEYLLDHLYVVYNHFWTNYHGMSLDIARSDLTVSIPTHRDTQNVSIFTKVNRLKRSVNRFSIGWTFSRCHRPQKTQWRCLFRATIDITPK